MVKAAHMKTFVEHCEASGDIHHGRANYTKAMEYYQKPVDMLIEEHGEDVDHPDVADALKDLA